MDLQERKRKEIRNAFHDELRSLRSMTQSLDGETFEIEAGLGQREDLTDRLQKCLTCKVKEASHLD